MRETNHDSRKFKGQAGEHVTVRVKADGDTKHLVAYVLDGQVPARVLPAGQAIEFNLKNGSGAQTPLQINLDFQPNGTYEIVVENVTGCPFDTAARRECRNTYFGPFLLSPIFTFTVE